MLYPRRVGKDDRGDVCWKGDWPTRTSGTELSRIIPAIGILLVAGLAVVLQSLNGSETVTLKLGVITLYDVPITAVAFFGLLAGMVIMLVASIHNDLRVRRILRDRLTEEDSEERARVIDHRQHDLFGKDDEES